MAMLARARVRGPRGEGTIDDLYVSYKRPGVLRAAMFVDARIHHVDVEKIEGPDAIEVAPGYPLLPRGSDEPDT